VSDKEESLRREILEKTREYFSLKHKPALENFVPGKSSVNYAGRIFDEREMVNLVDSSLDFWLTSGRFAATFEDKLAKFLGRKFALLTNSGSSANLLAFSALTSPKLGKKQIRPGDEVITLAAGFPTTVAPVIQNGAVPVFVDIELGTYNINVHFLEEARSEKTKAVMIAHTLGNPFNVKEVKRFCDRYGLWLIEDNCDALGARYDNQLTGTFGDIGTSSFYPPHHITMGEGGALYTDQGILKKLIESFRDWGRDCWCAPGKDNTCQKRFGWKLGELPDGFDHKYTYSHFGYNLKVTDMQAAVGVAQLDKLLDFVNIRNQNFEFFKEALKPYEEFFYLPQATPASLPSWFGFMLTIKEEAPFNRREIVDFLEQNLVQTRMLFAGNLLKQPVFNQMRASHTGFRVIGDLPITNLVMNQAFWLGVYPGINSQKRAYVIDLIERFIQQKVGKAKARRN
jgi:CDP-6-deoxy-D-xylo-4-hexulose-3-dehydrase